MPPEVQSDSRSELMKAIQAAGGSGKAKLRPVGAGSKVSQLLLVVILLLLVLILLVLC